MDNPNSTEIKNIFDEIEPAPPQSQSLAPNKAAEQQVIPPQQEFLGAKPKNVKRLFIYGGIAAIAIILIAGGAWAYSRGYFTLPFLSPKVDEVLAKTFDTFQELQTARYTAEVQITAQDKEKATEPLDLSLLENSNINSDMANDFYSQLFTFIPTDLDIKLQFGGIYNKKEAEDQKSENESSLAGYYSSGGTTMSVDLSLKTIGEKYYVLISKFPSLFFMDLTPYSGKWIEITKETTDTPFDSLLNFGDSKLDESANVQEQIYQILILAMKHKVISLKNANDTEMINGYKTYKVSLVTSRENIKAFYQELTDTLSRDFGEKALIKYDEKTVANFDEANFQTLFDYWQKNSTITFWIDNRLSIPRQMSFQFKFAPTEDVTKFKDKQLNLTFNFNLQDINESVKIEKPDNVVTWDEIDREVRGITAGEQKVEKQYNRITQLKSTLQYYNQLFGEYPESWEELKASRDKEATVAENKFYQELFQSSLNVMNTTDVFTEQEYSYQKKENGYEFTYQISFNDVSADNKEEYPYSYFVDGTNTTNEGHSVSLEKQGGTDELIIDPFAESKNKDTNSDGLSDYLETALYGTNINKKDTDDDGYEDKTEVDSGYNPNGSGKLNLPL